MKSTILITGVAGMIGAHVAMRFCGRHEEYNVIGLDDLSGGPMERGQWTPGPLHFIEGDCADAMMLKHIFQHYRPRYVIHCAAMAAENLSHNCRVHTYTNNLIGEANVRNHCIKHGTELMVSLSSIAVMGDQPPPYSELAEPSPKDPYGISKLAGELDAKAAKDFFGLNYLIFRPHNVIGTRQNMADRYRNVAAIFIRAIKENRPLPIFGDGLQTRAFSPVSYVADIIAASLERPETWNQVFNVGADEPMTIMDLVALLEKLMKKPLERIHLEARKEAVHAHMTHGKLHSWFPDIQPKETVEDCLSDMLEEAFASDIPPIQQGPEIEVTKNLPPSWAAQLA